MVGLCMGKRSQFAGGNDVMKTGNETEDDGNTGPTVGLSTE